MVDRVQPEIDNRTMKDKSHKGQRHKGCSLCDWDKRAGNGADRRPARDRRQIERARAEVAALNWRGTWARIPR